MLFKASDESLQGFKSGWSRGARVLLIVNSMTYFFPDTNDVCRDVRINILLRIIMYTRCVQISGKIGRPHHSLEEGNTCAYTCRGERRKTKNRSGHKGTHSALTPLL